MRRRKPHPIMKKSIWSEEGKDTNYQWYRSRDSFQKLRDWANEVYYAEGMSQYLDKNFLSQLRNNNFFARTWELKVAEYLRRTGLRLLPTNGAGADFCIELEDGRKIWIEVVLATADDDLNRIKENALKTQGLYNFPQNEMTLRYSSSLFSKASKIRTNYLGKCIGSDDIVLIAISGVAPGSGLNPEMEHFLRAITPMGDPVVHFSTDGNPLDPSVRLSTHSDMPSIIKKNGSVVLKQFLYPGTEFPFIDGVLFAEARDLQELMGRVYNIFDENEFDGSLDPPHIFPNYASKKQIPSELTDYFYLHKFVDNPPLISLEEQEPKNKL